MPRERHLQSQGKDRQVEHLCLAVVLSQHSGSRQSCGPLSPWLTRCIADWVASSHASVQILSLRLWDGWSPGFVLSMPIQ